MADCDMRKATLGIYHKSKSEVGLFIQLNKSISYRLVLTYNGVVAGESSYH